MQHYIGLHVSVKGNGKRAGPVSEIFAAIAGRLRSNLASSVVARPAFHRGCLEPRPMLRAV
jgi:hypothetical protein